MAQILAQNTYQNLSSSNKSYWYKLLHAKFYSGISQLDGENFFLSPHGKENPSLELTATIAAFYDPNKLAGWFHYPSQCVFRERFAFLKSIGYLEGVPIVSCPMFEEWKKGLNAESATLVFSSSYPNNPSSLFGHTLIRLNQKNKKSDLLDYAISFSAIPEHDDLGLIFAYKGLFGGYKGLIEVTKYYTKVMDYSNSESRDLLEYDLNLKPVELERLINHVWEIYQTTYANYYFLDGNCSSFLADLLAVALNDRPKINAHSRWYYLPSEMVRALDDEHDLITNFQVRPSLKKKLEKKLNSLTSAEKREFAEIISDHSKLSATTNINVLDYLLYDLDYKRYRTQDSLSLSEKELFRKALIKRSTIKESSVEMSLEKEASNRPELGHLSKFWMGFGRIENSHSQTGLTFKNGYHNLMDRDLGFDPFSQFDFISGTILFDKNSKRLSFDQFNFIHLTSLHLFTAYDPQLSWNVALGMDKVYQQSCDDCHKGYAVVSGGVASNFSAQDRYSILLGAFTEAHKSFNKGYRLGPVLELSYYINIYDKYKLGISTEDRWDIKGKFAAGVQNITTVKANYFPSKNELIGIEYKTVSKYGSHQKDSKVYSLGYGQHF